MNNYIIKIKVNVRIFLEQKFKVDKGCNKL